MGNQYQQIPNQNTTPSQRPYIPTNTQLDRRTNRTQLNHKKETVPQCTNLESKITNSKMPKKVPTQARKEFSDTYSVSTVIIETNLIEKHSDTTEKDERMHSMIQNEQEQQKPFLDLAKINSKPPEKELMELENRIRLS